MQTLVDVDSAKDIQEHLDHHNTIVSGNFLYRELDIKDLLLPQEFMLSIQAKRSLETSTVSTLTPPVFKWHETSS